MKKIAYLAGSIEFSLGSCHSWRDITKSALSKIGWGVYDPTDNEDTDKVAQTLKNAKMKGLEGKNKNHKLWKKFDEIVLGIQEKDSEMVLGSDLLIVMWNTEIKMAGTENEIIWALQTGIPIYSVINGSVVNESSWMLGLIRKTKIFDNLESLIKYMEKNNETKS